MKYTCAICGKGMDRAAYTIGGMAVGPKCGAKAGFRQPGRKKTPRFFTRLQKKDEAQAEIELWPSC